jgi:hypothetical protein
MLEGGKRRGGGRKKQPVFSAVAVGNIKFEKMFLILQ